MKDTFIFACFGTAIFIDLAFLGGLILAFIDYIKEKKMNNEIKNEIDWLYKSYSCRIEKALIMPTPEHWQLASTGYNHLSGFRDGLQAAGMTEEANYLSNLLKIYLDK